MLQLQTENSDGNNSQRSLLRAQAVVAFVHHEPELTLVLSGRGSSVEVNWELPPTPPDLIFELPTAEIAHRFWLGELNVMAAITSGQIRMRGNLLKAIALLPSAAGSQAAYRQAVLEESEPGEGAPLV
ncbi:hypothetical protein [Deinococcus peraridilitoris]|nr:hypothetical protein [Deinococcus peraridilitoris]